MADPRTLKFPELSLVVLMGASGSGKSTFARRHFLATEILSSDACRGLVSDDEASVDASQDAFDVLHFIAGKRLARGRLTVVDATNVQPESRAPLVALAREYHCLPVAIVLDLPEKLCLERNTQRPDRQFGAHVVRNHCKQLRNSLRHLQKEGFRHVFVLESQEEVDAAILVREKLWNDKRDDHGPFDVIGDVHGCFDELAALLAQLGYAIVRETAADGGARFVVTQPAARKAVFLGDLVDRGPRTPEVLRLVMDMCASGVALCVPGNHDIKLMRKLQGRDVKITHGLAESLAQLEREPAGFPARVATFIDKLVSHYVLDGGNLVVAHAGLKQTMQGRGSARVRDFALFGETTGETDEYGLPVRYPWAADYRGAAHVVYGHTPVPEPEWLNRTICIDTGCVFGGKLTALRWPEKELVSVPAATTYYEPAKPFLPAPADTSARSAQQEHDDVLDLEDVSGQRAVATRLMHNVTLREQNTHARARGDEPLRREPEVDRLPPADDVAAADDRPRGTARTPRRGLRLLPDAGRDAGRVRGEAHGLARRADRLPRRGRRAQGLRCHDGRGRRRAHAHGPALLPRARDGDGAARARARGGERCRIVGTLRDGLDLPRCRADALVGEGAGTVAHAVRLRRLGRARRPRGSLERARHRGGARHRCRFDQGAHARARRARRALHRGLPALLLAGRVGGRSAPRALPPARERRQRPRRARPPLAPRRARRADGRGRRAAVDEASAWSTRARRRAWRAASPGGRSSPAPEARAWSSSRSSSSCAASAASCSRP